MKKKNEAVHLCPVCNVVEMEFIERIESDKHFRMRRFKCPVCDHKEMYTCGGPNDLERQYKVRAINKMQKLRIEYKNDNS